MKTIKKYESFEELKSNEGESVDTKASAKKHIAFEKLMKTLYANKVQKVVTPKSK